MRSWLVFEFMLYNAPVHRKIILNDWFHAADILVKEWLAYSLDLNPNKKIWGSLTGMVHANGNQYASVRELKTALLYCWDLLSNPIIFFILSACGRDAIPSSRYTKTK